MRIYYGKRKLNKQAYEIYHEDRLDIYDKNDDDIISLEEYLAKEESQGYNAIPVSYTHLTLPTTPYV